MFKKVAFTLISSLTILFSAHCIAGENPDELIQRVTTEVLEIVSKDKAFQSGDTKKAIELVNKMVIPHFNFQHMTALAVGKEWRKATPEQQKSLTEEFKVLLVRTYANAFANYKGQKVNFSPLKMNPGDLEVNVKSLVQEAGKKPIQITYGLEKISEDWKVYDVIIEGISLVTNYRESFGSEIRTNGIDSLIAQLVAKNKKN